MITTIVLANTSIMSQKTTISFSVARTFKIYSLSNFQVCHTVLLVIITMLYIRFLRNCQSYNWQFVPFDQHLPILPPPSPGNHSEFSVGFFGRTTLLVGSTDQGLKLRHHSESNKS